MICTEQEAKEKTCPLTIPKASRLEGILWRKYQTRRCLGSGCMAWRWLDGGYCGFAGKPGGTA